MLRHHPFVPPLSNDVPGLEAIVRQPADGKEELVADNTLVSRAIRCSVLPDGRCRHTAAEQLPLACMER
jgi:hypothetical protein